MTDQKSSKGDDGRGQPPAAEQKTVEEPKRDNRLFPGGSMKAAKTPIGVSAMDHYTVQPSIKADLPDLSDTPAGTSFRNPDRRIPDP